MALGRSMSAAAYSRGDRVRFTVFGEWMTGTVVVTNGEIVGIRPDKPTLSAMRWRNPAIHDLKKVDSDA